MTPDEQPPLNSKRRRRLRREHLQGKGPRRPNNQPKRQKETKGRGRKNTRSAPPKAKLASGRTGALLKCSPFYWIPPLRWVPGWLRVVVWIGVAGYLFYKTAPGTFEKTASLALGLLCCIGLPIMVYAMIKSPKDGGGSYHKSQCEPWHPSGMSDKEYDELNDPRGDSTNPMQF